MAFFLCCEGSKNLVDSIAPFGYTRNEGKVVGLVLPYTIDEIKRRVAPVAKKYELAAVYLFDSYARGEATAESDVDLLVDLDGSIVHGIILGSLYNDMESALGVPIDPEFPDIS